MLGRPYVFGGRDINAQGGLDCAGFAMEAYHRLGINITNNADYHQGLGYTNAQRLYDSDHLVTPIDRVSTPQPGDLVFFSHTYDDPDPITHVAIVVTPGRMVGAQGKVSGYVDYGASTYWQQHLAGYGRVRR